MSGAKPCFGYPTRTEAVAAFVEAGMPRAEIAARIGIPTKSVSALLGESRRARPADEQVKRRSPQVVLQLTDAQRCALREHAARRDLSLDRLLFDLLDVIVEDKLVDAILDDGRGRR